MTTLAQAMDALEQGRFVGRERELATFQHWLGADLPLPTVLNVHGPGGVGKTALLQQFRRVAAEMERPILLLDADDMEPTSAGFMHALRGALGPVEPRRPARQHDRDAGAAVAPPATAELTEAIAAVNALHPVLIVDTTELLVGLDRWLQRTFLPQLDLGVRVIFARRYPLIADWSRQGAWHSLVQPLPLAGLSAAESRLYLQRRDVAGGEPVEQIVQATGGHLLALSLAADLVQRFGLRELDGIPEWHLAVRALVERLLHDVDDPRPHDLLDACSVLRCFDEATLAEAAGLAEIREPFARLCRLSVVRPLGDGLMLHDDVRRLLAEDLRWRRPERHRTLRLRALAYYRARMDSAPHAERERLVAERLALWEHGVVQRVLFQREPEPGELWVEDGTADDLDGIMQAYLDFVQQVYVGDVAAAQGRIGPELLKRQMRYPACGCGWRGNATARSPATAWRCRSTATG